MKNITVQMSDYLYLETCERAEKLQISRGAYLRNLVLLQISRGEELASLLEPVSRPSESVKTCETISAPVAESLLKPVSVVSTAASVPHSSLDVTAEERAAFAAKRAEADRKRRVLLSAMGISHPADAVLPATFFPGERDFAAAHPELA